eukprot:Nk52_evm44s914 gene=Nk52_evmTU44s914
MAHEEKRRCSLSNDRSIDLEDNAHSRDEDSHGADLGDGIFALRNQEEEHKMMESWVDVPIVKEQSSQLQPHAQQEMNSRGTCAQQQPKYGYGDEENSHPHRDSIRSSASTSSVRSVLDTMAGCFSPMTQLFPMKSMKKRLEKFEIPFEDIKNLEWIGSGAHGAVFKGVHQNRIVAIKKMKGIKNDMKELKLLSGLEHEQVVAFIGFTKEPMSCLVMEYCPGGSLYDYLRHGEVTPEKLLKWGNQIAMGMDYLHTGAPKKIVHRDLKSANILVTRNDNLKITDFGTSKEVGETSTNMTFAGTVAWMAPEVVRNEPCSEKVDVWSFGVVMWELLTGQIPYDGVDSAAIIWGVGSNDLHLPIPGSCPDGFALLMKQCWSPRALNRPSFKQILLHLDIVSLDFAKTPRDIFFMNQNTWRREIDSKYAEIKSREISFRERDHELIKKREEELKHAADIRTHFEQRLEWAEDLYRELAVYEAELKCKEKMLMSREQIVNSRSSKGHKMESAMEKLFNRKSRRSQIELPLDEEEGPSEKKTSVGSKPKSRPTSANDTALQQYAEIFDKEKHSAIIQQQVDGAGEVGDSAGDRAPIERGRKSSDTRSILSASGAIISKAPSMEEELLNHKPLERSDRPKGLYTHRHNNSKNKLTKNLSQASSLESIPTPPPAALKTPF